MTLTAALQLTPEQRRVTLAKLLGWKERHWTDKKGRECSAWEQPGSKRWERLPNFTTDLNEIAAVEARLTDEEHREFRAHLTEIVKFDLPPHERSDGNKLNRAYVSASADQRCAALIVTLSKGDR